MSFRLFILLLVTVVVPVRTLASDAEYVWNWLENAIQSSSNYSEETKHRYADEIAARLRVHSVRIKRKDRFTLALPDRLGSAHVREDFAAAQRGCIDSQPADVIARYAADLRALERDPDSTSSALVALATCGIFTALNREAARTRTMVLTPDDLAAVADVLETPGLAHFPNRIVKRDVLRALRSGNL